MGKAKLSMTLFAPCSAWDEIDHLWQPKPEHYYAKLHFPCPAAIIDSPPVFSPLDHPTPMPSLNSEQSEYFVLVVKSLSIQIFVLTIHLLFPDPLPEFRINQNSLCHLAVTFKTLHASILCMFKISEVTS